VRCGRACGSGGRSVAAGAVYSNSLIVSRDMQYYLYIILNHVIEIVTHYTYDIEK
jgi:hypothetical protein